MTIILVIIGLSLLILLHEAGHFFTAKWMGLKVDEFGFGFPPRLKAWKKGETEYSINWLPFGGFVRIAGETDRVRDDLDQLAATPEEEKKNLFLYQPAWKRSIIILAGVIVNFLIGWILISALFMHGSVPVVLVADVLSNSPAAQAGFKSGDIIRGFNTSDDFISYVNQNKGREISVDIFRGNKELAIKATPRPNTGPNEGALGVLLEQGGIPKLGFWSAIKEGFLEAFRLAGMVLQTFWQLVKNLFVKAKLLEGVVGPIGIFGVASQAEKVGFIYLIQLMALISVNLAVMNLVPFPALDGGRFFLILIEKIKGSPISPKVEGIINGVGFAFLLILMLLLTARDITRLF